MDIDLKNLFAEDGTWHWHCPCGAYKLETILMRDMKCDPRCPHCGRSGISFQLKKDRDKYSSELEKS